MLTDLKIILVGEKKWLSEIVETRCVNLSKSTHEEAFVKVVNFAPHLVLVERMSTDEYDEYLPVKLKLHYATANLPLPKILILGNDKSAINDIEKSFCFFLPMPEGHQNLITNILMDIL